eukprot:689851-Prymnesium_polylepis.1
MVPHSLEIGGGPPQGSVHTAACLRATVEAVSKRRNSMGCGMSSVIPTSVIAALPPSTDRWEFLALNMIPKAGSSSLRDAAQRLVTNYTTGNVIVDRSAIGPCDMIARREEAAGRHVTANNTLAAVAVRDPFARTLAGVAEILENHCAVWLNLWKRYASPAEVAHGIFLPGLLHGVSRFRLVAPQHHCRLVPHGANKSDPSVPSFRWDESDQSMAAMYGSVLVSVSRGHPDVHLAPQALLARSPFDLPQRLIRIERMQTDFHAFLSEAGLRKSALPRVGAVHGSAARGNRAWNLTLDALEAPAARNFCRAFGADYVCIGGGAYPMPCACNCSCNPERCGGRAKR